MNGAWLPDAGSFLVIDSCLGAGLPLEAVLAAESHRRRFVCASPLFDPTEVADLNVTMFFILLLVGVRVG